LTIPATFSKVNLQTSLRECTDRFPLGLLAAARRRCYNACKSMADWKQITARIRRARTSKDPAGQLSNLFQKTRDAMVAFELARYFETAGSNADAVKWYSTAAERFRRADWKTKAQEALVRLGGTAELVSQESVAQATGDFVLTPPALEPEPMPAPELPFVRATSAPESTALSESSTSLAPVTAQAARRRRGRRGGRNRRKPSPAKELAVTTSPLAPEITAPRRGLPPAVFAQTSEPVPPRVEDNRAIPRLPVEPATEAGTVGPKGRYGDPGLSSRISLLEMQFRRLLTCPPAKLNEADHAPVGPGVFLLSDSDLITYYYVEPCQTLRIAIGNLLRGGTSRRGGDSIKPRLAEHLGIAESRVTKYLADHCVVRWLQLDEGASHFAHFVTAVLRPSLNE
jgi:hypothetical protein